jgi:hypothetical protein
MPKRIWRAFEPVVEVPIADEMDDETFLKHLERRHADECKFETPGVGMTARRAMDAWLPTYRAFHDRLHKIEQPGQYDHTHKEDD